MGTKRTPPPRPSGANMNATINIIKSAIIVVNSTFITPMRHNHILSVDGPPSGNSGSGSSGPRKAGPVTNVPMIASSL